MPAIASFHEDCFTVSAGSFDMTLAVKQIESNWDALSHFPNRRARHELSDLVDRLNGFANHVDSLVAGGGALDAGVELQRFATRHVSMTRRAWAMDSRCMSWFIVGPSKFPTDRNRKRMDWADNAYKALREHVIAAKKAVERVAFPHGIPGDAIRANNPEAPDLLRARIVERQRAHAMMKAVNAAIRSVKDGDVEATIQAVIDATGLREGRAREIVSPREAWMGRGFPPYALSGELAEIKRLEGRLAAIERNRERGTVSHKHNTTAGAVEVVENGEAARIQLVFPDKPDAATRAILKRNGFRWAPSERAWQRHLNNNGRWAAKAVITALQTDQASATEQKPGDIVDGAPTVYRTMGRTYAVTASFTSDDEANAYMAAHSGEDVIAVENGRILIVSCADLGRGDD